MSRSAAGHLVPAPAPQRLLSLRAGASAPEKGGYSAVPGCRKVNRLQPLEVAFRSSGRNSLVPTLKVCAAFAFRSGKLLVCFCSGRSSERSLGVALLHKKQNAVALGEQRPPLSNQVLLPLDRQRFRQLEIDLGFRWQIHVLPAGSRRGRQSAYSRSLASSSKSSDQGSPCCSAAGDGGRTLAFAFFRIAPGMGSHQIILPAHVNPCQPDRQQRFALNFPLLFRIDNRACHL